MLYALKTAIKQSAAHYVEVAAERVHNMYQRRLIGLLGICVTFGRLCVSIVCRLSQRVVENLVEACTNQLFAHQIGHLVLLVFVALDNKR